MEKREPDLSGWTMLELCNIIKPLLSQNDGRDDPEVPMLSVISR